MKYEYGWKIVLTTEELNAIISSCHVRAQELEDYKTFSDQHHKLLSALEILKNAEWIKHTYERKA